MRMKSGAMIGAVLLAACGSGGGAPEKAEAQTTSRAAKPFDVSGVTPGMSAERATAAMAAAGWRVSTEPGLDWGQLVERSAARQGFGKERFGVQGRGVGTLRGTKGPEELLVSLRPTPGGSGEVKGVTYTGPMAGRTWGQAFADLRRRYGEPTRPASSRSSGEIHYCSAGEGSCRTAYGTRLPSMAISLPEGGSMRVALMSGSSADVAWQARLDEAVAQRTGGSKNSF